MNDPKTRLSRSTRAARGHGRNSYDDIEPWLDKLAALPADCAERTLLREEILRRCLPLAQHIARRYCGRGESYDDLYQVASLGLIESVDRYSPERATSFLAYAVPTMLGEVRRYFRDRTWALRVPRRVKEIQQQLGPAIEVLCQRLARMPTAGEIAVQLEVDISDIIHAMIAANAYRTDPLDPPRAEDGGEAPSSIADFIGHEDPGYQLTDDSLAVGPLLDELPDRVREILRLRFFDCCTQAQIADRLGISQMQVSRILTRTLTELREQALPG